MGTESVGFHFVEISSSIQKAKEAIGDIKHWFSHFLNPEFQIFLYSIILYMKEIMWKTKLGKVFTIRFHSFSSFMSWFDEKKLLEKFNYQSGCLCIEENHL